MDEREFDTVDAAMAEQAERIIRLQTKIGKLEARLMEARQLVIARVPANEVISRWLVEVEEVLGLREVTSDN